jgi:hypothetical protein
VRLRSIALFTLLPLAATGCADATTDDGGPAASPSPPPAGPSDLVLRWGYEGGFTPPAYQLTNLPSFSLYGDGTIVRPGPQIEIYPGPALPALESAVVDDAGFDAIVDAALDAHLGTVPDLTDMGTVAVADAPDAVFVLNTGDVERTVRVYALTETGGRPPGMPDAEFESRRALLELLGRLGNLEAWLPEGSLGTWEPFEPAGARVFVSEHRPDADLPQPGIAWPLPTPLAGIGEAAGAGYRCVAVTGADWKRSVEPAARTANQLTPWTSEGHRYAVAFRPLLPDESSC